jgi:hypothetical protein
LGTSATIHGGRLPAGHSEGFVEAFATLYADAATQIGTRLGWHAPSASADLLPTVRDGARGIAFVTAALASSQQDSAWTRIADR